jgi:hypothetical protein
MPKVCEVGAVAKLLPQSLLSRSWLWSRPVHEVTPAEILVFLRTWKDRGRLVEARRNIDSLMHETYRAMAAGELGRVPYATFAEPDPAFMVSDLCEILEPLSHERRRAAVFALETGMIPKDVLLLDWRRAHSLVQRQQLSTVAEFIVRAQPRHMRLDYVFWEFLENQVAAPLFGFEEDLHTTTGLEFDALLSTYRRMVWVDAEAEFADFTKEIH